MPDLKQHESFAGLIFDCDGTLADTMPLHFAAWQDVLTGHGIQFDEDLFYSFAGQPTVTIVDKLLKQQGLQGCLLYTSPSPRDATLSRMPSSA